MATTPNLNLVTWPNAGDNFDYTALANNFTIIDNQFSTKTVSTTPVRFIEQLSAVPNSGNTLGRMVYLTVADSGFAADTLIQYNGTRWESFGQAEIQSSLPISSNYIGRIVVLTASSGGFSANDVVINTDGANSWQKIGGISVVSSVAASTNNYAGKLIVLNTADNSAPGGPYDAWSVLVYNNTSAQYQRVDTRGINTGNTLPISPYLGQVFCLLSAQGNYQSYDVLRWNGTYWQQLTQPPLVNNTTFSAYSNVSDGFEVYYQADSVNGINWHLRYNINSASTYKWEYIGGPSLISEITTLESTTTSSYVALSTPGPAITLPRAGDYDVIISAELGFPSNGTAYMSYDIGSTGAVDADAITSSYIPNTNTTTNISQSMRSRRKTGLSAVTLTAKYKSTNTGVSASFGQRYLSVVPVRLI